MRMKSIFAFCVTPFHKCVLISTFITHAYIGAEFVILPGMRKLYDVLIKTLLFDYLRYSEDEQINTSQSLYP